MYRTFNALIVSIYGSLSHELADQEIKKSEGKSTDEYPPLYYYIFNNWIFIMGLGQLSIKNRYLRCNYVLHFHHATFLFSFLIQLKGLKWSFMWWLMFWPHLYCMYSQYTKAAFFGKVNGILWIPETQQVSITLHEFCAENRVIYHLFWTLIARWQALVRSEIDFAKIAMAKDLMP